MLLFIIYSIIIYLWYLYVCCLFLFTRKRILSLQFNLLIGKFYRKQSCVVSGIEYYGFRFIVYFKFQIYDCLKHHIANQKLDQLRLLLISK